jgi:hypothetical protein
LAEAIGFPLALAPFNMTLAFLAKATQLFMAIYGNPPEVAFVKVCTSSIGYDYL